MITFSSVYDQNKIRMAHPRYVGPAMTAKFVLATRNTLCRYRLYTGTSPGGCYIVRKILELEQTEMINLTW
jgi:hypothetical protein